ncbi:MAG: hypothetical protein H6953_07785 [Chromatiaceae bacterium]|nr:hypothetical protein [Chromatiaceae bacterium]MCP5315290.1 hypothetical protein [Chromatiaceae bacterium]
MQTTVERITAQRAHIEQLERALWRDGVGEQPLLAYQSAYRELERLIAARGDDRRHHFVILIPVADSPGHLRDCLSSLLEQCRLYGYGGMQAGRYRKVSVLLADDSANAEHCERQRATAGEFSDAGLDVEYFGIAEQLALLDRLADLDLGGVIGHHAPNAFGHKGQAMMRNIAYLRLAEMHAQRPAQRLLFYTIDADQLFAVQLATPDGGRRVAAINYLFELDRIFADGGVKVLTGKVVGDPPVSPAVMAGNFLDDVTAFVEQMARCSADDGYRQPQPEVRGSGEAAYHDMAELFGFRGEQTAYRYHCTLSEKPSNAECFAEFAQRLDSFFHGEHATRVTWYQYQEVSRSVVPARTVYTGNYVFSADALDWFIPFAPLRLRMSGPTMGRLMQAALSGGFVSANLPMLHRRTRSLTGASEFRPGVVVGESNTDLSDEFERQFYGDVMLFSIQRLVEQGFPGARPSRSHVESTLQEVDAELRTRYADKQAKIEARLEVLSQCLDDPARWWHSAPASAAAVPLFGAFLRGIRRNFGRDAAGRSRIESPQIRRHWHARQAQAIIGLPDAQAAWQQALRRLRVAAR